jgi:hypothetical protein
MTNEMLLQSKKINENIYAFIKNYNINYEKITFLLDKDGQK